MLASKLKGPGGRHDNDHADVRAIDIVPTKLEILAEVEPYLPANRYERDSGFGYCIITSCRSEVV